ncbi:8-amino-7-oxononanoate synthase [Rhodocytophaga rosea]|uniref:8-amino-7-oxononanoate synthase n=1 Tax=Rhodocytophaga rosea TaxID=2704465 RepID=A0A6C0GKP8_9BACT|nr:8-amino-7-oxononanoate synthase [Rhodocytophaga rosea]QHT68588.1 8-amino-7-oxononanoate synthase [Rhodocytophaga rosea]
MQSIEQRLALKLLERENAGNLRKLSIPAHLADFCSNDYLGLAANTTLHQQIQQQYANLQQAQNGSTGSRLISGNSAFAVALEGNLAGIFQAEAALLINSGYAANTAILSAVPQKNDTILYDEYIHASLKEGARLSFANRFSFRHNDCTDLEKKLKKATGEIFIVAESVYSMDGDFAPLTDLLDLCRTYTAHLIWDEAHSTGIWGENGSGLACETNRHPEIFARIYTFGKAMGVHGACIAGSRNLIDYLINFARPFIYTTALPLHSLVSIAEAFQFVQTHAELRTNIHRKIQFFTSELNKYPALKQAWIESHSPIQVIKIGGNLETRQVATQLQQAGFDVRAILSPTVKEGEERLRICLHIYNEDTQISKLVEKLAEIYVQVKK